MMTKRIAREPTPAMVKAADGYQREMVVGYTAIYAWIWRAMYDAAPPADAAPEPCERCGQYKCICDLLPAPDAMPGSEINDAMPGSPPIFTAPSQEGVGRAVHGVTPDGLVERLYEMAGYKYQSHTIHAPQVMRNAAAAITALRGERDELRQEIVTLRAAPHDLKRKYDPLASDLDALIQRLCPDRHEPFCRLLNTTEGECDCDMPTRNETVATLIALRSDLADANARASGLDLIRATCKNALDQRNTMETDLAAARAEAAAQTKRADMLWQELENIRAATGSA